MGHRHEVTGALAARDCRGLALVCGFMHPSRGCGVLLIGMPDLCAWRLLHRYLDNTTAAFNNTGFADLPGSPYVWNRGEIKHAQLLRSTCGVGFTSTLAAFVDHAQALLQLM
jgi:hypothetical protein